MDLIALNSALDSGSWALPRLIRRAAPWDVQRPVFPVDTWFEAARDGTGVDVYCMDSGIDLAHAELSGRATNVWEFYSSAGAGDDHGHGTATASAAGGVTCGLARGALFWSFKIYNASGLASPSAIAGAFVEVLAHYQSRAGTARPAVVLANFGSFTDFNAEANALIEAGMIVVCPSHNYGVSVPGGMDLWPALTPNAVTVGGISACDLPYYLGVYEDSTGAPQTGTNYGTSVDIMAPAQACRVARAAVLGGGFRQHNGTSYAAPYVAGVLACMLEGHPRLTGEAQVLALRTKLLNNATTGKLRAGFGFTPLPDRIAYLDPVATFETF